MRIDVPTGAAAAALADYLQRCECSVEIVGEKALEVTLRSRRNDSGARLELGAYLRVWSAMYPEMEGVLVAPVAEEA
jgi:hypothetical protein